MRRRAAGGLAVVAVAVGLLAAGPSRAEPNPLDGRPVCHVSEPVDADAVRPDDGQLRIATFNVLHSETDDGDRSLGDRLPLIADAIVASGADIVGAQEVTRNAGFDEAGEYPQKHGVVAERLAAELTERTGDFWWWCFSRSNPHVPLTPDLHVGGGNPLDDLAAANGNIPEGGDFSEGLAILSRFPIEDSRFRRLIPRAHEVPFCWDADPFCPLNAAFDARQVLWARVATPAGDVDLFTTHLAHGITAASNTTKFIQANQAAAIVDEWSTAGPLPDFLVGDFNSPPDGDVHDKLRALGFIDTYRVGGGAECDASGAGGCSGGPPDGEEAYDTDNVRPMGERIDYVWAKGNDQCRRPLVTSTGLVGTNVTRLADGRWLWPSDHLGFVSAVTC